MRHTALLGPEYMTWAAWDVVSKRDDNITPNGRVVRYDGNAASFDYFQGYVRDFIKGLGVGDLIEKVQYPANLRLQNACPQDRPYATSKLHTDIWNGEDPRTMTIFMCFGGADVGLEFYQPIKPPPLRKVADYDEYEYFPCIKYDVEFEPGNVYFADSFCLHRTVNKGPGERLSLDTRIVWKQRLPSDGNMAGLSNYLSLEEYYEI